MKKWHFLLNNGDHILLLKVIMLMMHLNLLFNSLNLKKLFKFSKDWMFLQFLKKLMFVKDQLDIWQ